MSALAHIDALHRSPEDSARFGFDVWRGDVARIDAPSFIELLERERADIAIVRVPAGALHSLRSFDGTGLAPIVADTRVTYDVEFTQARTDGGDIELVPAKVADAPRIEALVHEIFAEYATHYHANPLLDPRDILDGYAEWAAGYARFASSDRIAWLVQRNGKAVGFSCCALDAANDSAVGILNGVVPDARGSGIYRGMFRRMLRTFRERGVKRFSIATQAQNIAVQRVWTSEGLGIRSAENTIHLNALFGRASRGAR